MQPHHLVIDSAFRDLVVPDAPLERLAGGCAWAEGPVWLPREEALIWSDVRRNRMLRWTEEEGVRVYREPSNYANGNTLDLEGRLVTCEHVTHRVVRTEPDGRIVTLVDRHEGLRLDSPNDVVVCSDGTIWFTDPPYGILSDLEGRTRGSEIGVNRVYRFEPDSGRLSVVGDGFDRPNGIAFSPDEALLYVSDSGAPRHLRWFRVDESGRVEDGGVFARVDQGVSDGFRVDRAGNLWSSAADGIQVFSPDGRTLGKILVPEKVANCAFGGADGSWLFITATTSLYRIRVAAVGAAPG